MTKVKPFGSVERALKQIILDLETALPINSSQVGGDFGYDPNTMDWYIRIDRVGGRSNQVYGDFTLDVEVFGRDYLSTDALAYAIEALLLSYPHRAVVDNKTMIIDYVEQNSGPDDLPWDDDSTYRIGATYVFTVRR